MLESHETEYDRLIEQGMVTYSALAIYLPVAVTYCYRYDKIKISEISEFLKIPIRTARYRFVQSKLKSLDLETHDAITRFAGKAIRRFVSPANVFSCEDNYVDFLKWRDDKWKDNIPDKIVSDILELTVRRIQMLKRDGNLIPGLQRGTTLAASVRVYKKMHFAKSGNTLAGICETTPAWQA